jgi:hypothetical protein
MNTVFNRAIALPQRPMVRSANIVAPEYQASAENNDATTEKKVVVQNKRPQYVPNTVRNYYPEFP